MFLLRLAQNGHHVGFARCRVNHQREVSVMAGDGFAGPRGRMAAIGFTESASRAMPASHDRDATKGAARSGRPV
jgi:hypothetical protein